MREPDTFLLLLTGFVIGINGRRLEGSLKWLGSRNQNSDLEFLPERDSIQVPVTIVQGKSEIIIDRNPISPNNSIRTFSLLSLLSKGSKGSNPHFALHSLDTRRVSTRSRNDNTCAEDIPEWNIYHRVYNKTGKCHIPGKGENPCPENMQFYLINGESTYGECDCKIYAGSNYRPLIYWAPLNQCFHLFDKGPCASGEWLTINSNESTPLCQKTICPESLDSLKPWFLLNSTCYQLSTRAFCPGENQTVQYGFNDLEPNCFDSPVKPKRTLLNDALTLPCKPGYKKHGSEAKECKASV